MKLKRLSIIITFLIFAMGIYLFFFGTPWKSIETKKQFEVYLEDKYGIEFEIEKIEFDFMHRTYFASVYPVSEPSLLFYVWQYIANKEEIHDLYEQELEKYNNEKK